MEGNKSVPPVLESSEPDETPMTTPLQPHEQAGLMAQVAHVLQHGELAPPAPLNPQGPSRDLHPGKDLLAREWRTGEYPVFRPSKVEEALAKTLNQVWGPLDMSRKK